MVEITFCTACRTHPKAIERHFQYKMKTLIRTNYYCECKPRRYYGEFGMRDTWERAEIEEAKRCFKCGEIVPEDEEFEMVRDWCKKCYKAWLGD